MEAFDYAVADRVVLPPAEEPWCTERVLRLDGSYLAFGVSYRVPEVALPPSSRGQPFTFGCLAPQYKISPAVVAVFARILVRAPHSRLLLRNVCLDDVGNRAAIRRQFTRLGVKAAQLRLEGFAHHYSFLKTYDRIDVALDTFPYSGGTTTMEALWQGVPILALAGDRWVARIAASLLQAAGLGEWVLPNRSEFIRRAVQLASSAAEAERLFGLRATMRRKLAASAACQSGSLCRQLEGHYRAIARRPVTRSRSRPFSQPPQNEAARAGAGARAGGLL